MPLFLIRYYVGSYAALRAVTADTEAEAIRKVQAWADQQSSQANDESYRVVVSHTRAEEATR